MKSLSKAIIVTTVLWGGLFVQHCHADTLDLDFMASFHALASPILDGGICDTTSVDGASFVELRSGGSVPYFSSLADETIFTCRGDNDATLDNKISMEAFDFDDVQFQSWILRDSLPYLRGATATPETPSWLLLSIGLVCTFLYKWRKT